MAEEYGASLELVRDVKSGSSGVPLYSDAIRTPEPPPATVGITPLLSSQVTGRSRCVELTSSDFVGQDTADGQLNLGSITVSEQAKDDVAACGFGQYGYKRAFTKTGQYAIGEIMARNPNYRWILYWQFGHCSTLDPNDARPLDQAVSDLLTPHIAKDINGNDFAAWVNPSDGQVVTYWANYTDAQGNVDTALIDAHIQLLADAISAATYKPSAILVDHYSQEDSGHWAQAGNEALDLLYEVRQPSVAFADDPAQQTLFNAQQTYFQQKLLDTFDPELLIFPNGNGAWPGTNAAVQAKSHGWFMEGYGTGPWSFVDEPYENVEMVWAAHTTPEQFLSYPGRTMPMAVTDLRPDYELDDPRAKLGRATALIFDCWWKYRPMDKVNLGNGRYSYQTNEAMLNDPDWDAMVAALGTPTGVPTRDDTYGTLVKYSRTFTGGTCWIIIDTSKPTYIQILEAGINDSVPPVQSGISSEGGIGFVKSTCFTDAYAERRVKATAVLGGAVYNSGWMASFQTTASGATIYVPVGTYNMEIRSRDAWGNFSGWQSAGQATSAPDFG